MSTDSKDERRPPSGVLLSVGEGATELLHLILLDQVWRKASESPADFSESGRETLLALGDRVDDTFAAAERHVSTIRDFFALYPAWTDEHLRTALASKDLPVRQRETLERILGIRDGNYAERGVALGDSLIRQLPDQRALLQGKVKAFREGMPSAGELTVSADEFTPPPGSCEVLALGTMASLLLCPETGLTCASAFIGGAALVHWCA